jgi:hypothetical protein
MVGGSDWATRDVAEELLRNATSVTNAENELTIRGAFAFRIPSSSDQYDALGT